MRRLRSGHIGFAVVVTTVAFQPEWSNPLWEMAEFTPASEPDRILAGVELVIVRLGEVDRYDMEVTDDNIRTDQLPLLPTPAQLPSSLSFKGSCTAVVLVLLGSLAAGLWLWRLRIRAAGAASNSPSSEPRGSADAGGGAPQVAVGWNLIASETRSP